MLNIYLSVIKLVFSGIEKKETRYWGTHSPYLYFYLHIRAFNNFYIPPAHIEVNQNN